MERFIDDKGNVYRLDDSNNLFRGKKCLNQLHDDTRSLEEANRDTLRSLGAKPLSLVVGHLPKFKFGYGDTETVVNTGKHEW